MTTETHPLILSLPEQSPSPVRLIDLLPIASDADQAPYPPKFDEAHKDSEIRRVANSIDAFSYSIMPGDSTREYALYGHTKQNVDGEDRDIVARYDPSTVLPEKVWQDIQAASSKIGPADKQKGRTLKTEGYSVLIFNATADKNGGIFITKDKPTTDDPFGLGKAKDSFPALFKPELNQVPEGAGRELAFSSSRPIWQTKRETARLEALNGLFHDVEDNMSVTIRNAMARNPDLDIEADKLAPAVVAASSLEVAAQLRYISAPNNKEVGDVVNSKLLEYVSKETRDERKAWIVSNGISSEDIDQARWVEFRMSQTSDELPPTDLPEADQAGARVGLPTADINSKTMLLRPEESRRRRMREWLAANILGREVVQPPVPAIEQPDDDVNELLIPNNESVVQPPKPDGWLKKRLRERRDARNNELAEQLPPSDEKLRRRRVGIAAGVLVVGSAVALAAYISHKTGTDATAWVNNLSLPTFGGDKSTHATNLMEGLGHGNGPDGSTLANVLPSPAGRTVNITEGTYVWDIAQANLSPDATPTDVYTETARIMQANNMPVYPDAADPFEAARSLDPEFKLFVPNR